MGSFAEHGLKASLDEHMFQNIQVALKYHQNYSVILLVLAIASSLKLSEALLKNIKIAFFIFLSAILCFCGSLYAYSITGIEAISFIAPVGGITMMLAWLFLIYMAFDN